MDQHYYNYDDHLPLFTAELAWTHGSGSSHSIVDPGGGDLQHLSESDVLFSPTFNHWSFTASTNFDAAAVQASSPTFEGSGTTTTSVNGTIASGCFWQETSAFQQYPSFLSEPEGDDGISAILSKFTVRNGQLCRSGGGDSSSGDSSGYSIISTDAAMEADFYSPDYTAQVTRSSPLSDATHLAAAPSQGKSRKNTGLRPASGGGFTPRALNRRARPGGNSTQTFPSSSIDFRIGDASSAFEPYEEAIAQVKEMIYRAAVMRPVSLAAEPPAQKPKRKNARISSDPQTVAARQRRERVSERLRALQRLVPGGTKMDTATMLDEAAGYLKFLKSQVASVEKMGWRKNAGHHTSAAAGSGFPFA